MTPLDSSLPPIWESAGFLIGFVFSLLILSFVIRDSWLVRAAQYLLVGVTLAYTVVLVWRNVLWTRLFVPLLENPLGILDSSGQLTPVLWNGWLPLAAGLLLWAAGIDYLRSRSSRSPLSGETARTLTSARMVTSDRRWLRHLAAFPLALLVGVGLGAGVAGAIQGTLLPQFQRAGTAVDLLNAAPPLLLTGLLTLAVTGGALLHLQLGTGPDAAAKEDNRLPSGLRSLLAGWAWLGERALWLAAGVIFARLFASRITLLIARLDALFFSLQIGDLWRWVLAFVQGG